MVIPRRLMITFSDIGGTSMVGYLILDYFTTENFSCPTIIDLDKSITLMNHILC